MNLNNNQRTTTFDSVPAVLIKLVAVVLISIVAACSTFPKPSETTEESSCRQLYAEFTRSVMQHAVLDTQSYPIPGFPYLHVDRFLAGIRINPADDSAFNAWLDRAQALAHETYTIEYANLPAEEQQRLLQVSPKHENAFIDQLKTCATQLRADEIANPSQRSTVLQNINIPDDYQTWQRIVGLYAITALPVVYGIANWHSESRTQLQQHYSEIATQGTLIRYQPNATQALSREKISDIIRRAIGDHDNNPLAIPEIPHDLIVPVFASYAPVFEIDTVTNSDRIGTPVWDDHMTPSVNVNTVSVFYKLSYSFFDQQILPQLNYIIWFPSRPCTSFIDILCGHMDGIMWRVTLNHDGMPIHYDTVHNCGCYHTFFPTRHIHKRDLAETFEETAFTPINAPELKEGERIVLRIAPRSHHIVSLVKEPQSSQHLKDATDHYQQITYDMNDYQQLRSLKSASGQHKSLFQANGLVAGTQRSERFILWPMGVPSPGSMRQWGHHATAFVGRRYFDDPCLLDNYYLPAKSENRSALNHATAVHTTCIVNPSADHASD